MQRRQCISLQVPPRCSSTMYSTLPSYIFRYSSLLRKPGVFLLFVCRAAGGGGGLKGGIIVDSSSQGAGIIMEGWPYTASCLAQLGESDPAGVICTVMDGPCRLPGRTVPQLRADGIFSCCYKVNVHHHLSCATSHKEGMIWNSIDPCHLSGYTGDSSSKGAGIIMEGWSFTVSCIHILAQLGESDPAVLLQNSRFCNGCITEQCLHGSRKVS